MNSKHRPIREKIAEAFDLPREIVLNVPRMVISGNGKLFIENHKGILAIKDEEIQITSTDFTIKISGNSLSIKEISSEAIMVDGNISGVEFV